MFAWPRIYLASPKNEFHELHLGNRIWFMVSAICLLASVAAAAVALLLCVTPFPDPPLSPCCPCVCLPTVYWYFMRHFALQIALIAILGTFIALDICITRIAIANLIVAQPTDRRQRTAIKTDFHFCPSYARILNGIIQFQI